MESCVPGTTDAEALERRAEFPPERRHRRPKEQVLAVVAHLQWARRHQRAWWGFQNAWGLNSARAWELGVW